MIAPSSEFEVVTERNNDSILVEWWLASWSNGRPIYLSNQVGEVRNKKGKNKLKINCKSCYSFSSAVFTKNKKLKEEEEVMLTSVLTVQVKD